MKSVAQARKVPGAGRTQGNPGQNPFDITHPFQQIVHRLIVETVQQRRYCLLALAHALNIPKWTVQPASELPGSHGGGGAVHHPGQGVLLATHQVGVDFQVPAAGGIQYHGVFPAFAGQFSDMWQCCALGLLGVLQQAAGSANGQGQVFAAKAGEIAYLQLLGDHPEGGVRFKQPGALAAYAGETLKDVGIGKILADQDFSGSQALKLTLQGFKALQFRHREPAAGNIQ